MTAVSNPRAPVVAIARNLYAEAPAFPRTLQSLRPYICPFEDLLPFVPETGRMLDIGCGAGLFLGLVGRTRPGVAAIGFDASEPAIAVAQDMAAKHFPAGTIDFRHSAVGDPWPAGPFDVVSIVDVLHHIPPAHQQQVMLDAYDHVAPGGVLIYKDMADRPLVKASWNRLHDILMARQWIHYRRIDEVERWLVAAGGVVEQRAARSLGLYAHEWRIVRRPG